MAAPNPNFKKRGRPPGKNRRPLKKWNPNVWEPVYDLMVLYSSRGISNKDIAEKTGYSEQHVSNVLTSQKAIEAKKDIIVSTRTKIAETFDKRAEQIADLTMTRIHQLLTDDEKFENKPFAIIDRGLAAARTLLPEKVAKPQSDRNDNPSPSITNIQNNFVNLPKSQLDLLSQGLSRLEEVKKLHGGNGISGENVDPTAIPTD